MTLDWINEHIIWCSKPGEELKQRHKEVKVFFTETYNAFKMHRKTFTPKPTKNNSYYVIPHLIESVAWGWPLMEIEVSKYSNDKASSVFKLKSHDIWTDCYLKVNTSYSMMIIWHDWRKHEIRYSKANNHTFQYLINGNIQPNFNLATIRAEITLMKTKLMTWNI